MRGSKSVLDLYLDVKPLGADRDQSMRDMISDRIYGITEAASSSSLTFLLK